MMKAELVTMPNDDLKVVNAARVSFAKESLELTEGDKKLIRYLAKHKHWSPFAHAQEVFDIWMDVQEQLEFFRNANLAGFRWSYINSDDMERICLRGSLLAWIENYQYLPEQISWEVMNQLQQKYPFSVGAYTVVTSGSKKHPDELELAFLCTDEIPDEAQYSKLQTVTLRMKTPIFVARQLVKHQQDLVWNEVSRRYVTDNIEFYMPPVWKGAPDNKKQGANADVEITEIEHPIFGGTILVSELVAESNNNAQGTYNDLLDWGIAPEQARMVLPLSLMTEWYWTGSLDAMARICKDRLGPGAQGETSQAVRMMAIEICKVWPNSWAELIKDDVTVAMVFEKIGGKL
jgi:thymidylate synthase (FAD)